MMIELHHQQAVLADVLNYFNYPILAKQALKETNVKILHTYARFAARKARKLKANHPLDLLKFYCLLPTRGIDNVAIPF